MEFQGVFMSYFSKSLGVITLSLITGVAYFLSPLYGVDYSQKPKDQEFKSESSDIKAIKSFQQLSLQWNLDPTINPNPTFEDYIAPISVCATVTHIDEQNTESYGATSKPEELKKLIESNISKANVFPESQIRPQWSATSAIPSCEIKPNHLIQQSKITTQAITSDENIDGGPESLFKEDPKNLEIAKLRDVKIKTALGSINNVNPEIISITELPPIERKFSESAIKALLNKEYPLGKEVEKLEILSKINLVDKGYIDDPKVKEILNQYRGIKIQTIKEIHTDQIISIPTPVGLTPLLLLIPSVRMGTFQTVRFAFTTTLFAFNKICLLVQLITEQLLTLSIYLLRRLRIYLRELRRAIKKLLKTSKKWSEATVAQSKVILDHEIRAARIRLFILKKITTKLIDETQLKIENLNTSIKLFGIVTKKQSIKLIYQLQIETVSLMAAQYLSYQIVNQNIREFFESLSTAAKWNAYSSVEAITNSPRSIISNLTQTRKLIHRTTARTTSTLIQLTIETLMKIVTYSEELITLILSPKKPPLTTLAIESNVSKHDLSDISEEKIIQSILETITQDVDLGIPAQDYSFKTSNEIIKLQVHFHGSKTPFTSPIDPSLSSIHNYKCADFRVTSK